MNIADFRVVLGGMVALMLLLGSAAAQDARSQLQLLQQMYKEGLITKDVYEQKQRDILGTISPNAGPSRSASNGGPNHQRCR